jgi:hypothetical protein
MYGAFWSAVPAQSSVLLGKVIPRQGVAIAAQRAQATEGCRRCTGHLSLQNKTLPSWQCEDMKPLFHA